MGDKAASLWKTVLSSSGSESWVGEEAQVAFHRFDTNGDGVISKTELDALLKELAAARGKQFDVVNNKLDAKYSERWFAMADLDHDGAINFAEFSGLWNVLMSTYKDDIDQAVVGQNARDARLAE